MRSSSRCPLRHPASLETRLRTSSEVSQTVSTRIGRRRSSKLPVLFTVYGWPNGFAFVLSFLAPLWTIGTPSLHITLARQACSFPFVLALTGGFDASVHISEEASNARVVVPWAIVTTVSIAGVLGWGVWSRSSRRPMLIHAFSAQCYDCILHGHRPRVNFGEPYWPTYGYGRYT